MSEKPDLVITAISGYTWEKIRPFALSLIQSGFQGDIVVLATNTDDFTIECLDNRGIKVVQSRIEDNDPRGFVIKHRFVPLLRFLAKHKHEYRYVIWADAGDQIFQTNPSEWLEAHAVPLPTLVCARECWRIKDEVNFNDPWAKASFPNDYDWLRNQEVLCGGTVAGDADTVYNVIGQIYQIVCDNSVANDQSALAYAVNRPFNLRMPHGLYTCIPRMVEGWTATCSAFDTTNFQSPIGLYSSLLTDRVPVFDLERGLVLTPDGKKLFSIVHQYNRDIRWVHKMHEKYRWD